MSTFSIIKLVYIVGFIFSTVGRLICQCGGSDGERVNQFLYSTIYGSICNYNFDSTQSMSNAIMEEPKMFECHERIPTKELVRTTTAYVNYTLMVIDFSNRR